jgi:hypothetical protein
MILTADKVREIFLDCLFKDGEDTEKHVQAEGVVYSVGFHPERLQQHRQEILTLLFELPDQFQYDKGGGWSFLNACDDRHGVQWTGEHQTMEQLVQLGVGIGAVKYLLPRDLWAALPGGVPYFSVTIK